MLPVATSQRLAGVSYKRSDFSEFRALVWYSSVESLSCQRGIDVGLVKVTSARNSNEKKHRSTLLGIQCRLTLNESYSLGICSLGTCREKAFHVVLGL